MKKEFDIAVSYASEQREYVEKFVNFMEKKKLKVYFDRKEQARMQGKLLHEELAEIYSQNSMTRIIFLSNEYVNKPYTKFEAEIILAENVHEKYKMFIFKFDDVSLPGLNRNMIYSTIREYNDAKEYAKLIYASIKNIRYKKKNENLYQYFNFLIFNKLKLFIKNIPEMQIIKETQKLTSIYRIIKDSNLLLYFQVCKAIEREILYLWLYKMEPMEKNGSYNGLVSIENDHMRLNNQGILNTSEVVIKFNTLEELSNIIYIEAKILIEV